MTEVWWGGTTNLSEDSSSDVFQSISGACRTFLSVSHAEDFVLQESHSLGAIGKVNLSVGAASEQNNGNLFLSSGGYSVTWNDTDLNRSSCVIAMEGNGRRG